MRFLVFILVFSFSIMAIGDEFYIVASGSALVKEFSSSKKSNLEKHNFMCYPLKMEKHTYEKKFAEQAYEEQIRRKFKECRVSDIIIAEFDTKKAAQDYYKRMSKDKVTRLTLPKSSIERIRKAFMKENGITEKGPPLVEDKRKSNDLPKKAFYDIYD